MKTSICLLAILTLSACGKDSDKKPDYGVHFEKLQEASRSTLKVGTIILGRTSGEELSLNEYTGKVAGSRVSKKEKSIVLKIDGNDLYTFEETQDLERRTSNKKVVLSKLNDEAFFKLLQDRRAQVSSDENFFRASLDQATSYSENGVGLSYNQRVDLTVDLRAICNTALTERLSSIRGNVLEDYYTVEDLILESTTSCDTSDGALMTIEELRKLPLAGAEFCDERDSEEVKCEAPKDMRYLLD